MTHACHCRGCQIMTASAFSLTVAVPSAAFNIVEGNPVPGGLRNPKEPYMHCDWCKAWVFTKKEPDAGYINVRAMMLDDPSWFEPFIEVWTSEKLSWASTPAKHGFAKEPDMSAYPSLLREFAASDIGSSFI
nr:MULTISPECIES: GFA family protein [unclassified Sphingomonas]